MAFNQANFNFINTVYLGSQYGGSMQYLYKYTTTDSAADVRLNEVNNDVNYPLGYFTDPTASIDNMVRNGDVVYVEAADAKFFLSIERVYPNGSGPSFSLVWTSPLFGDIPDFPA